MIMQTAKRPVYRTLGAVIAFLASIVCVVAIIGATREAPVDSNRIALYIVLAIVGAVVGFLLIRRPRF